MYKNERRDTPAVWQSTVVYKDGSDWVERHESTLTTRWHKEGFGYDEIDSKKYDDEVYGENLTLSELKAAKMNWLLAKNADVGFSIKWEKVDY